MCGKHFSYRAISLSLMPVFLRLLSLQVHLQKLNPPREENRSRSPLSSPYGVYISQTWQEPGCVHRRLTAHRNHGAEGFRGGLVMTGPQIPVFPSQVSKKSLFPWGHLPHLPPPPLTPGFYRHKDTNGHCGVGAESDAPPPPNSAGHAMLCRFQRSLGPAWP